MAIQKITADVIATSAVTTDSLSDSSITAAKLHTTLDLTGKTVTVATASAGDNDTTVASTAFVSTAIANLADSAPSTLNTLNELAAALGDDANFSTTVTNSIALKAPLASPTFTGNAVFDTSTLVVDATNNRVGIGTTSPDNTLMVQGASTTGASSTGNVALFEGPSGTNGLKIFIDDTENAAGLQTIAADDLLLNPHGGSVGIGTDSPSRNLVVQTSDQTDIAIIAANDQSSILNFGDTDDDNVGRIQYNHATNLMSFRTNTADAMHINSSGKLFIGGVSSTSKPTGLNKAIYLQSQTNGDVIGYSLYTNEGTNNRRVSFFLDDTNGVFGFDTSASSGVPQFVINSVGTERLRIDSSGNLLVGQQTASSGTVGTSLRADGRTFFCADGNYAAHFNRNTSDGVITHFAKNDNIVGSIGVEGGDSLYVQGGTTSGSGLLYHGTGGKVLPARNSTSVDATIDLGQSSRRFKDLYLSNALYSGSSFTINEDGAGTYLGKTNNTPLRFITNNAERMRIDSVGEVSIKRAGSGGTGILKALNLNHAGTSVNDGAKISFTAGTSTEGAGIASTGQALNSADLRFYTGGTTEAMRINSSGQVRLQVDGGNAEIEALRICSIDPDMPNYHYNHAVALGFELAAYDGGDRTSKLAAKIVGRKGADGGNDWYTGSASTNFQGQLDFYTRNDDVLTKHMDLDEHGDLTLGGSTAGSNVLTVGRTGTSNQGAAILNLKSQNASELNFFDVGTNTMRLFSHSVNARWKDVPNSDDCIQFEAAGNIDIDGSYLTGGFDYAEYFESTDGTAIPVGTTVVLVNEKVRAATSGEQPIGVVRPGSSGTSVVGGAAGLRWAGKYLKDDYDAYLYDTVDYWTWKDVGDTNNTGDEDQQCWSDRVPEGWVVPSDKTVTSRQRKRLNPDFVENLDADGNQIYVNRESRDEWNCIGLLGQVPITKGQVTNSNWTKLKDRSASVELWFIK